MLIILMLSPIYFVLGRWERFIPHPIAAALGPHSWLVSISVWAASCPQARMPTQKTPAS